MTDRVQYLDKKILARGWCTLTSHTLAYTGAAGDTKTLVREVYDHGNAAAVLLIDRDARAITLVRQFRLPAHLNGDAGHVLEVCAGLLDGDDPQTCARKEAMEETGIAPKALIHAFDLYASPGSLSEKVHCFVGFYTTADCTGKGGGLAHEGEEIEIVTLAAKDALALTRDGTIIDAKSVALIQFAALEGYLE
jgi:GDP-mannose pyrophosphatase NudK